MSEAPKTGQLAVSGVAQPISTAALDANHVLLKCPASNAAAVYFGAAGVTAATGHAIDPGDSFEIDNGGIGAGRRIDLQPQDIYVVGTAPDRLTWIAAG